MEHPLDIVDLEQHKVPCDFCNATGLDNPIDCTCSTEDRGDCVNCMGTGKLEVKCPDCKGTKVRYRYTEAK